MPPTTLMDIIFNYGAVVKNRREYMLLGVPN